MIRHAPDLGYHFAAIAYRCDSDITYKTPFATTGVLRTGWPMSMGTYFFLSLSNGSRIFFSLSWANTQTSPVSVPRKTLLSTQYVEPQMADKRSWCQYN